MAKRPAAAAAVPVCKRPAAAELVCKRPAAKSKVDKRVAWFSHERSRSQVLVRRAGGGSFVIKYTNAKEEKRAIEKAKAWVQKEVRAAAES